MLDRQEISEFIKKVWKWRQPALEPTMESARPIKPAEPRPDPVPTQAPNKVLPDPQPEIVIESKPIPEKVDPNKKVMYREIGRFKSCKHGTKQI